VKPHSNFNWRLAALKNGFQDALAYRVEFLIEFFSAASVPAAMQWVLWYALFQLGGANSVGGMSYSELIHYTLVSILFTQIRGGDHDFELAEMIRTGQLSQYLLRPVSVVELTYIRGVAPKLFIAGCCTLLGIFLSQLLGFSPLRLVGAMFLALLGNIIHYQIGAALATSAFFWEEAHSILMVKNMMVGFLSGELIPLNLFPPSMSWIWQSTPFYLYVYGPTQYALGHWTHQTYLFHLGLALLWMILGWAFIQLSWNIGIKRYLSLGG